MTRATKELLCIFAAIRKRLRFENRLVQATLNKKYLTLQ